MVHELLRLLTVLSPFQDRMDHCVSLSVNFSCWAERCHYLRISWSQFWYTANSSWLLLIFQLTAGTGAWRSGTALPTAPTPPPTHPASPKDLLLLTQPVESESFLWRCSCFCCEGENAKANCAVGRWNHTDKNSQPCLFLLRRSSLLPWFYISFYLGIDVWITNPLYKQSSKPLIKG